MENNAEDSQTIGQKRSYPFDLSNIHAPKKRKQFENKSAVCIINELHPSVVYKVVDQTGPSHAPVFTLSVELNGSVFKGQGRSKKLAKQAVAERILASLGILKKGSEFQQNIDFSSDSTETGPSAFNIGTFQLTDNKYALNAGKGDGVTGLVQNGGSSTASKVAVQVAKSQKVPCDKNPVGLLNELHPGLYFRCVPGLGEPNNKFTMTVSISGKTFEGTGSSKKLAKSAAAKAALAELHNITFTPFSSPLNARLYPEIVNLALPQVVADHVAKLVINKFTDLVASHSLNIQRTVLAGIVMTVGPQTEDAKLICVTTGTKCINGENMSVTGSSLNDTHAEIIARRCLIEFLYLQLEMLLAKETVDSSIFVKVPGECGYQLKDNVKFHLYISTAPCGDARIFSPRETELADDTINIHPNRKSRGQLRTKIESGEGTIPLKSGDSIQTWDGILQGGRLRIMSCSDKIARWNVVGVQGALLSHFVKPIYLESIVLGHLFHPAHLYRAICGRIEKTLQDLPRPYRLNKPCMNLITSQEVRQTGKTPSSSVNWTTEHGLEIINSVTGKDESGNASHLCKQKLFKRFLNLLGKIESLAGFTDDTSLQQYSEAKSASQDYNLAKQKLVQAFHKAELGMWLKKPTEQDLFELDGNISIKSEDVKMLEIPVPSSPTPAIATSATED